ncbi:MAG: hypothetical protein DGJ47_000561 [Rickettsiaceae bacterium]
MPTQNQSLYLKVSDDLYNSAPNKKGSYYPIDPNKKLTDSFIKDWVNKTISSSDKGKFKSNLEQFNYSYRFDTLYQNNVLKFISSDFSVSELVEYKGKICKKDDIDEALHFHTTPVDITNHLSVVKTTCEQRNKLSEERFKAKIEAEAEAKVESEEASEGWFKWFAHTATFGLFRAKDSEAAVKADESEDKVESEKSSEGWFKWFAHTATFGLFRAKDSEAAVKADESEDKVKDSSGQKNPASLLNDVNGANAESNPSAGLFRAKDSEAAAKAHESSSDQKNPASLLDLDGVNGAHAESNQPAEALEPVGQQGAGLDPIA